MLDAATEVAETHYRSAIADQLRGNSGVEQWHAFEIAFARAIMLSQLLGFSAIVEPLPIPEKFVRRVPFDPADIDLNENFLVGDFIEAIQLFDDRIPDLRGTVIALQGDAQALAHAIRLGEEEGALSQLAQSNVAIREAIGRRFWVSGISDVGVINLKNLIADAIEGKISESTLGLVPFIDKAQAEGAEGLSRARLETVYRTNLNTAFNDGQVQALRGPEVKKLIPLVMLLEVQDRRTRGNPNGINPDGRPHYQMHKYVNTLEYFESRGIVPPNGYNCRGSVRSVSNSEARRNGWQREDGTIDEQALSKYNGRRQSFIDSGEYPDPGFNIRRTPSIAA